MVSSILIVGGFFSLVAWTYHYSLYHLLELPAKHK